MKFEEFDEDGFSPTNEPAFAWNWVDAILIIAFVLFFVGVLIKIL